MNSFTLPHLSAYRRNQLTQHAMQVLEAQQILMKDHQGPHAFMLAHCGHEGETAEKFIANRHYPKGDRIDYRSGGQYFYHCHREDMDTQEHGHFHVFIRKTGWPKSYRLPRIPDRDRYLDKPMTHLISISLNRHGLPIRLFTVNRWVSHECWFEAERLGRMTRKFSVSQIETRPEYQLMDQWVEHLIHLFMPQILWLQQQRDQAITKRTDDDPYHDKTIEELSSLSISVEEQVQWLLNPIETQAA